MVGKTAFFSLVTLGIYWVVLSVTHNLSSEKVLQDRYFQVYQLWEQASQRNPELPPPLPPPTCPVPSPPLLSAAVAFGFWGAIRSLLPKRNWLIAGWGIGGVLILASLFGQLAGGAEIFTLLVNLLLLIVACLGGVYAGILADRVSEEGWIVRLRRRGAGE